jgi:hypothetical protein
MGRLYRKARRWWRKQIWREVPKGLVYRSRNHEVLGKPIRAVGMHVLVETGPATRSILITQAQSRKEFLMAWYALGGGVVELWDGTPVDPDDEA